MDGDKEILDLIKNYRGKEGPNEALENRVYRRIASYKQADRTKIIDWIFEHQPKNYNLDVMKVNEAIRETGVDTKAHDYIPSQEWTCDCCGLVFQYVVCSTYEDKHDKGLFDTCPRCGFPPVDTMLAKKEAEQQRGHFREWYARLKKRYYSAWEDRKNGWIFNKGEDDEYDRKAMAETVNRMRQEAADIFASTVESRRELF